MLLCKITTIGAVMVAKAKPVIKHVITMGDSLSDRGTFSKRRLFGLFSADWFAGLSKLSPRGRFTNGYTWDDILSLMLSSEFLIEHQKKVHGGDATDISDAVLDGEPGISQEIAGEGSLDNDRGVTYEGSSFVRNYNEGGMTAHSYKWVPTFSLMLFLTRLILSTLGQKRQQLLDDDRQKKVSDAEKRETLVVEWSGANDLITANTHPTKKEAEDAVQARLENAEALYNAGYRHFVLFNLPDLSKTPRFQAASADQRAEARDVSVYFNDSLQKACEAFREKHPDAALDIFNVNDVFDKIYENPKADGFDPAKAKTAYTTSPDFNNHDGMSIAPGYLFWDNIHPSANLHGELAYAFYKKYSQAFSFEPPKTSQLGMFAQTPVKAEEAGAEHTHRHTGPRT